MIKTALLFGLAFILNGQSSLEPREQVRQTEIAFARTMADRDHAAFTRFLAPDAIFLGSGTALRGAGQIAKGWKPLYEGPKAAFSWSPDSVEVMDGGKLAISTGPVLDASGKLVSRFTSVWRREPDGKWRIILDNGCSCNCGK